MLIIRNKYLLSILLLCSLVSTSCAAEKAVALETSTTDFKACPDSPNCVSSDAQDDKHHIDPLAFSLPEAKVWKMLKEQIAKMPRTVVVVDKPDYLHVECRSAVFGFVDDLELQLRAEQGVIAVRSAARTGYYDFGANRQRIDDLRAALLLEEDSP